MDFSINQLKLLNQCLTEKQLDILFDEQKLNEYFSVVQPEFIKNNIISHSFVPSCDKCSANAIITQEQLIYENGKEDSVVTSYQNSPIKSFFNNLIYEKSYMNLQRHKELALIGNYMLEIDLCFYTTNSNLRSQIRSNNNMKAFIVGNPGILLEKVEGYKSVHTYGTIFEAHYATNLKFRLSYLSSLPITYGKEILSYFDNK